MDGFAVLADQGHRSDVGTVGRHGGTAWIECDERPHRLSRTGPEGVTTIEIRVPKLGMEMTEATLARWLVDEGAEVVRDQPLYLLETDKVESEIGAPISGMLHRIGEEGTTYPVGETIAELREPGTTPG